MPLLSWSWSQLRQKGGDLLAIGVLIFSWYVCYLWIMGMTEGWGAPWDTTTIRPPVGHWQRSLNDFFESGPGAYLPTIIFLATSIMLYITTLIYMRHVRSTSFVFGITNFAALIALVAIVTPMQVFLIRTPAHLTSEDWLYWGDFTREWPLTVVALMLCVTLFLIQPILVRRLIENDKRSAISNVDCC